MSPSAAVSDFGGRIFRRFSEKYFWRPQGPLIKKFEVSMDASFQAGSNDTIGAMSDIGGRIYRRLFTAAAISARTYVIT